MQREAKLQLLHRAAVCVAPPKVLRERRSIMVPLPTPRSTRLTAPLPHDAVFPIMQFDVVAIDCCGVLVWSLDDE